MARKDLVDNADFKLYQEDLKKLLAMQIFRLRAAMDTPKFLEEIQKITSEIRALEKVLRLTASYGERGEELKMESAIKGIWTDTMVDDPGAPFGRVGPA